MPAVTPINASFPEKLSFLFQPKRYKVAYGGRGGAKSWGFGRAILLMMLQKKLYVLCARELQNSIAESVHKLLSTQIEKMGLSHAFEILNTEIRCKLNGGEIQFAGIRNNTDKIKSYEDYDICWVEEANKVTKSSWNILIPTFRKPGSEIWISFNPELVTDYTYTNFVKNPPPNAAVVKMTWRDNPWFTDVLMEEMVNLKARDYDEYLWVWEGECKKNLEGAVYAKELRTAREENRICRVPYQRQFPVDVIFDLGRADSTSIWFRQRAGFEFHYINFMEASGYDISYFIREIQKLNYEWGTVYLPHDAKAKTIGTKLSVEEQMKAKFPDVRLVKKLDIADGITAARTIFPVCYFDENLCSDGIQHLEHYRYEVDPNTKQFSDKPLHDEHSHAADSFRYSAVASRAPRKYDQETGQHPATVPLVKKIKSTLALLQGGTDSWLN
jgi:phage terminase large subunit